MLTRVPTHGRETYNARLHPADMTLLLTPVRLESETVAVVPAQALSWHRVQLPRGVLTRTTSADPMSLRLRSVLEGLLEDRLLDDPSTLHIALQPHAPSDAPVWVAACEHAMLAQGLEQLKQQGWNAQRLVPEWEPGSDDATPTLWITGTPDTPMACWCDTAGVHQWPLTASLRHVSAWPQPVRQLAERGVEVVSEPALAAWTEQALERAVSVVPAADRVAQRARTSTWNLAQGRLSLHQAWPLRLRQGLTRLWQEPLWRPARWAAVACVLVQVLAINAAAWQARQQEARLQAGINAALTSTFPDIRVVVDAPVQMQRAFASLQQGSGAPSMRDFDVMLQAIQQNQHEARTNTSPNAIVFESNQLRLSGTNWDEPQAQALRQGLSTRGLVLRREEQDWVIAAGGAL